MSIFTTKHRLRKAGVGVGSRGHDGRGRSAGFRPWRRRPSAPRPGSCATESTSPRLGSPGASRVRSMRPAATSVSTTRRASPMLISTALATSASSVTGRTNVTIANSKVHQIGEKPFDGTQHGRGVLYINGATGTIDGDKTYDFQKNGMKDERPGCRWQRSLHREDFRDGREERHHRRGSHELHRPERHRGPGTARAPPSWTTRSAASGTRPTALRRRA